MKGKIFIATLIGVFAVLIAAMQDTLILAGGSNSGELIVVPNKVSQWSALLLFSISTLLPVKTIPFEKQYTIPLKTILILISVVLLLASGHTYRYSDRAHAMVDTWYFIPLQTIAIDPDDAIASTRYSRGTFFVSLSNEKQTRQVILTGPDPFGIDKTQVVDLLQNFGFEPLGE